MAHSMATVLPFPNFNPKEDCEILRKAMKGVGTDEDSVIAVLCHRSWQQRAEIERVYKQLFNEDLQKQAESETSGNFYRVVKALLQAPCEVAAHALHHTIDGAGTDEPCLVEIICTRSSEELQCIKDAYSKMYGKSLDADITGDTSGFMRRLLVLMLNCHRPPDANVPDLAAAATDAKNLYEAGQNKIGTDEDRFNTIVCSRSYTQLRAIFECYARDYKTDMSDVISSEFSGDIADALLAVVDIVRNRPGYFATRLHEAMHGAGTDDELLLRIIVSRCDVDLGAIKAEYSRLYGKPLSAAVQNETSGDYKKALLAMIGD